MPLVGTAMVLNYDLRLICDNYDVIFLQEHWLRQDELNFLNDTHSDFIGQGVSAINSSDGLLQGRSHGGVVILLRKSIAKHITVQNYDDPRII